MCVCVRESERERERERYGGREGARQGEIVMHTDWDDTAVLLSQ